MPTNNAILDGLQSFNQSLGELAQQRALTDASQKVQQIQQSELNDNQKQQALQQFGQQFALHATAVGMDPSQAFGIAQHIGPGQPLIQSGAQAAVYGTPEQQLKFQEYDQNQQKHAMDLKHAEDEHQLVMQSNLLKSQQEIADKHSDSAKLVALIKANAAQKKADMNEVDKLNGSLRKGKDFDALQSVTSALGSASQFVSNPSPYGDNIIITALAKAADPSTGVKQQEFNEYARAAGIPQRVEGLMQWAETGKRLTPEQRTAALQALQVMGKNLRGTYESRIKPATRRIKAMGAEVDHPFEALDAQQPATASTLPAGTGQTQQQQGFMPNFQFTK